MKSSTAFFRVLDELMKAQRKIGEAEPGIELLRRERNDLVRKIDVNTSVILSLRADLKKFNDGMDAVGNLYDEVEQAVVVFLALGSKAQADRLREKLAAAKKYIDPIPF